MKFMIVFLSIILMCCGIESHNESNLQPSEVRNYNEVDTLQVLTDFLDNSFQNDSIIDWVQGDLNGDSIPDYIILLQSTEEYPDITGMEETFVRELVLLETISAFPNLEISKVNGSIIDCSTCGGAGVGDPFMGVVIDSCGFKIEDIYGACDKTYTVRRFDYNPEMKEWYLTSILQEDYSCNEIDESGAIASHQIITTQKDFGLIRFDEFNIDKH